MRSTSEGSQPFPLLLSPPTAPYQPPQGPRLPAASISVALKRVTVTAAQPSLVLGLCARWLVWASSNLALRRQAPGPLGRECQVPGMWFRREIDSESMSPWPWRLLTPQRVMVRGEPEHRVDSTPILRAGKIHSLSPSLKFIYSNPSPHPFPHNSAFPPPHFPNSKLSPFSPCTASPASPADLPAASFPARVRFLNFLHLCK